MLGKPTKDVFIYRSRMAAPAEEVFQWHARDGAFERLTPPWEHLEVVERHGGIKDGARVVLHVKLGPFLKKWVAEHHDYRENEQFCDRQISGPFAYFDHRHHFQPLDSTNCQIEEQITYQLPLGFLGKAVANNFVRQKLQRLFDYRHRVTQQDLVAHARTAGQPSLRIAIAGATGLIGRQVVAFLTSGGHQVWQLVRRAPRNAQEIFWDPEVGRLDAAALEGLDAVIHLGGETIMGRWNVAKKARIRSSRIQSTHLLGNTLTKLQRPPRVFICASAIGYYGNRGEEILREEDLPGNGFLPEVCREWEEVASIAARAGCRVVKLRIGIVLHPQGGALAQMLLPFQLGLGGRVGNGRQYMSWIAIDDIVQAIHHALINDSVTGPINLVAPNPVTNQQFTKTLGQVLSRPTIFPVPTSALRLVLGEVADELALSSTRVHPGRLLATGYQFLYPNLEQALRHVLGK
jgi:uncharacterized protein